MKDALLLSDDQSGEQDSQIANAHDTMADEESIEKSQENGSDENAFHGSNLSPGIETLEQKREPSLELCNSVYALLSSLYALLYCLFKKCFSIIPC